jgi:hypothetical protein
MMSPAVTATQFTAYPVMAKAAISIGNCWQGIVAARRGYVLAAFSR